MRRNNLVKVCVVTLEHKYISGVVEHYARARLVFDVKLQTFCDE